MAHTGRSATTLGEWEAKFDERTAVLDCRHRASTARLVGKLEFRSPGGEQMPILIGPTPKPGQLMIYDSRGDGQMYLRFNSAGGALTITLTPRRRTAARGQLTLCGTATLGRRSFACRTFPPQQTRVVQISSGPADSALNDSLFDIARDVALRLRAEHVAITTKPAEGAGKPTFAVTMQGRIEEPAASELTITVHQGFYRSRYVPWYRPLDKKRLPTAPTGWMSWNTYFDQAGEKENLDEARIGAKYLKPYGLQIWSIESWQDNSPCLPVSKFHHLSLRPCAKQFPHGMPWLAMQIRQFGFVPGLWSVPFGTGDEEFYRQHKGWFLHHPDGRPMSNWCGKFVLDPSQPAVRRFMTECNRRMVEWGYDFFKIDGQWGGHRDYSAQFYEVPEVRAAFQRPCENPFELCTKALRKGIGPNRILLAGAAHFTGPEVAVTDAARVGADVASPGHPTGWRNYLDQARMILTGLFVHGIVWYCDPDTLLVGTGAPIEQARLIATAIALSGQVTFAGDKLGELTPERMWLLQRCLPVCDVRPLDLYPINQLAPIWDLKISRPFAHWDIVSLFNFSTEADTTMDVEMAELGLDAEKHYLVYDFWAGRLLGRFSGRVSLEVKRQSNMLLAIHEDLGRPQFLSTDRHLTQGAVSLTALEWDESLLTLSGESEMVAGEQTRLTFSVPAGFQSKAVEAARAQVGRIDRNDDGMVVVEIGSSRATTATWQLRFAAESGRRK